MEVARGLASGTARFRPGDRLLQRRDFQRCYREGRREHGVGAVLHAVPTVAPAGALRARLGITASRKVGGAVVRNRLRRWVREVFRKSASRPALRGLDLVVHLKPDARNLSFHQVESDLERLLSRIAARWAGAAENTA